MKNILGLLLAGLALNAQAQTVVHQPLAATVMGQHILDKVNSIEGSKANPAVVGYVTSNMMCGPVTLPPTSHTILSTDSAIDFNIKVVNTRNDKTVVLNSFGFSTTENVPAPVSNTRTQTYIGSIKTEKNPSTDPEVLAKQPTIVTVTPQQITTGTFMSFHPSIVNNTIVTKLCFEQSELLGFKKLDNTDLELPETKGMYGLWNLSLTPGKEMTIMVDPQTSLKIKADIRKR